MSTRKDSSFIDPIDSDMAPAFLGLLLFGREESYRWLVTMSFLFLDVFSCQFAKETLRYLFTGFIVPDLRKHLQVDTHLVRLEKSIETTFCHEKGALTCVNAPCPDTLFVL